MEVMEGGRKRCDKKVAPPEAAADLIKTVSQIKSIRSKRRNVVVEIFFYLINFMSTYSRNSFYSLRQLATIIHTYLSLTSLYV